MGRKAVARGPWNDIAAWRRGLIAGAVAALHLGLLLMLLRPAAPLFTRRERPASSLDAIRVQLLSPPSLPALHKAVAVHRARTVRMAPPTPVLHPAAPDSAAASARPLNLSLPSPADADAGDTPLYIPGGRDFGRSVDERARIRARLPGMWGARSSHYRMRDPRHHGVAGIARMLQRALGVNSHQCLRLEKLKKLSKTQLASHGLVPDDLPALAVEYGCR